MESKIKINLAVLGILFLIIILPLSSSQDLPVLKKTEVQKTLSLISEDSNKIQIELVKEGEVKTKSLMQASSESSNEVPKGYPYQVELIKLTDNSKVTVAINNDSSFVADIEPGRYLVKQYFEKEILSQEYNLSSSEDKISLAYAPLIDNHLLDGPWVIKDSEEYMPLMVGVMNSEQTLNDIYIYDANDNDNEVAYTGWDSPVTIEELPWFYTFYVNRSWFKKNANNEIAIKVKFDIAWNFDNWEGPIYIKTTTSEPIPKINQWYCGDTHYHSDYTNTGVELGAPLLSTILVGDVMGMDWVTATDHSNSYSMHKNDWYNWNNFTAECNLFDECLIGTEINCGYTLTGNGNHLLAYNYNTYIDDKFNGMLPGTDNPSCKYMVDLVKSYGGFSYAAHPETDMFFGLAISKWKNYSLPFNGLEIWNGDLEDNNNRVALQDGLEKWKDLILGRNGLKQRKVFISAGSDAHGNLNTDYAKEYTCVYASSYSKQNLFAGLKNGNSYLSNNGALIFSINNTQIGKELNITYGNQVKLDINYNLLGSCYLNISRGIIGDDTETQVGATQQISGSGSKTFYDIPTANSYYRVDCISSDGKKRIYTNPIWVNVNGAPITEKIEFTAKIKIEPTATCAKYSYWIEVLSGNLPSGMSYVSNYHVGSQFIKIKDLDNKEIDLKTYQNCTSCGVVPTCSVSAGFSDVLYNGQAIVQGSCLTTSAGTSICYRDTTSVRISRNQSSPQINCSQNSDCGINGYIGNDFCSANNVSRSYISFICNNAGTSQSYCTNQTTTNTINVCSTGSCQFIGNKYCKGDSVYQMKNCTNAGCFAGSCSVNGSFTSEQLIQTCQDSCDAGICKNLSISLIIINPLADIYNDRSIMFNLSSVNKLSKLVYSDNGGRESSLCTNCYGYARKRTLSDGNHTLLFRGILPDGKNVTNQTRLFIDSTDPRISTTKPSSNKYTNGSDFYIKYTESNCQLLKIVINGQEIFSSSCDSGKNIERTIPLNISLFNGQEVQYKFVISDIANNTEESRLTKVKVDTTAPEIRDFNASVVGRSVSFNMTVLNEDKNSFNKVEYIDSSDSRPAWRSLCTSLKNNNCYKKL